MRIEGDAHHSGAFFWSGRREFTSRWSFDVELLLRMLRAEESLAPSAILEVPLKEWRDVDGSKLSMMSRVRAGLDLLALEFRYR